MTSWIVLDSGVFIATVVDEEQTNKARHLVHWIGTEGMNITAPTLCLYEMASTMRKIVRRGQITSEDGARLLHRLTFQPIEFVVTNQFIERAYALATEHNLSSAYDAQYLAIAESLQCDFWTYDKRLFNSVEKRLSWVKYIASFEVPS